MTTLHYYIVYVIGVIVGNSPWQGQPHRWCGRSWVRAPVGYNQWL